jgi:hypothetical protein
MNYNNATSANNANARGARRGDYEYSPSDQNQNHGHLHQNDDSYFSAHSQRDISAGNDGTMYNSISFDTDGFQSFDSAGNDRNSSTAKVSPRKKMALSGSPRKRGMMGANMVPSHDVDLYSRQGGATKR